MNLCPDCGASWYCEHRGSSEAVAAGMVDVDQYVEDITIPKGRSPLHDAIVSLEGITVLHDATVMRFNENSLGLEMIDTGYATIDGVRYKAMEA